MGLLKPYGIAQRAGYTWHKQADSIQTKINSKLATMEKMHKRHNSVIARNGSAKTRIACKQS